MLVLVRHAMPLIDPATDPATWPLAPDGVEAARAAAHRIPPGAALVSSDEPKAYQTLTAMRTPALRTAATRAAAAGREVTADPRLREVARPLEPDDFATGRLAYVGGQPPAGWEAPAAVIARIDAAIADHQRPDTPLVLCGHGMSLTTWLTAHGLVTHPRAFWSDLRLPDVFTVTDGRIQRT